MSEEVIEVGMRKNQPSKKLGEEYPRRREQQEQRSCGMQTIRELTKDQGPGWEGSRMRLGDRKGQAAQGFLRVGSCHGKPGEGLGSEVLGLCWITYIEWVARGLPWKQRDQASRRYMWAMKDCGGLDQGVGTGRREEGTLEGEWSRRWNSK